jgi:hypothetical protein
VPAHALSPPVSPPLPSAPAPSLLARRMAFVTGKGGVGETTVAAALALAAARPAVVCELGTRAQLARAFGCAPAKPGTEVELSPGLSAVSIDPDTALEEWMARDIGRPGAALLRRSDAFRYLVAAAPGARELIGIGKAWDLTRDGRLVVLDAPSSGHAVGVLQAPRTFSRRAWRHREGPAQVVDRPEFVARHPCGQAVEQDRHVRGAVAQRRRHGHDDIGAGQEIAGNVGWAFDAGGRGERRAHASVQERDPRAWQPGVRRAAEAHAGHHGPGSRGSISGCRKRLRSTSASAPASSRRRSRRSS